MAGAHRHRRSWYVSFTDEHGRRRRLATKARTKSEAKRIGGELERRAQRQRLGLEPLPIENGGGTVAELLTWWLQEYVSKMPSEANCAPTVRKHLLNSSLAKMRLVDVRAGDIERLLQTKVGTLSPRSINIIRGNLAVAFTRAIETGKWNGSNPVAKVRRRKVPRRTPDYLRPEEVPPVLAALPTHWRPLFATAIYSGLRKGELLALHKADVDLQRRLLTVARSNGRDTTKGGHGDVIPIAAELVPFLEQALAASPTDLLFPGPDGRRRSAKTKLCMTLRRALARGGIVLGYTHICHKTGCHHSEDAPDKAPRRCSSCNLKLWPKARVRPLRFHDLRHTTASLLMMAGANPAAVQRILRHSDPRITTEVYGHLAPEYLRSEVDRLQLGVEGLAETPERPRDEHTAPDPSASAHSSATRDLAPAAETTPYLKLVVNEEAV